MKKYRMRLLVYSLTLFAIIGLLSFSCFNTWKQIYENKKLSEELRNEYNELLETEETLESEVVKLQDSEYIAKYAREKYLFTKDGELIIDMSSDDES